MGLIVGTVEKNARESADERIIITRSDYDSVVLEESLIRLIRRWDIVCACVGVLAETYV